MTDHSAPLISETDAEPSRDDRLRVFYDGSCPLCRAEIDVIRQRRGSDAMVFEDISKATGDVAPGLSSDTAMRRMHVQLPNGELRSGARAFLEIWGRVRVLKPVVAVLKLPPLPRLLERAYRAFLIVRPRLQSWVRARVDARQRDVPRP